MSDDLWPLRIEVAAALATEAELTRQLQLFTLVASVDAVFVELAQDSPALAMRMEADASAADTDAILAAIRRELARRSAMKGGE